MSDAKTITMPDGTVIDLKDEQAREDIAEINSSLNELVPHFIDGDATSQPADRDVLNYTATANCWISVTANAVVQLHIDNGLTPIATVSGTSSAQNTIVLPLKAGQKITSTSAVRIATVFPML